MKHPISLPVALVTAVALIASTPIALAETSYPSREDALARPSVVVQSGTTSSQYRIGSPPADTTYDLRGLTSTAYPASTTYPLSLGKDAPGVGTVVLGGTVLGTADPNATWQDLKDHYDGTALLLFGRGQEVSYDLHADNMFDFFRPRPPNGDLNGASFLIEGCRATNVRDDAIENDQEMSGTIRDCVFDGINSGVSIGQNSTNPAAVTTIEDSTFIFRPFPNAKAADGSGHAVLFKQMGGGQVVMRNDIVCYSETPIGPERLTNWMPGSYENVTIVLGPGFDGDGDGDVTDLDHPGTLPQGVTQTRDWSLCDPNAPSPSPSPSPTPSTSPSPSASPSPPPAPSAPTIAGLDPTSAAVGTTVTLSGSGFTGATDVRFNGTDATFTVDSDTLVRAVVPQGATDGPVSIEGPGGVSDSPSSFTITVPAPEISGLDPEMGIIGASITIAGSGFTGATKVRFNGTDATFGVDSDTQITAVVPQGATTGRVSIDGPGGTAQSPSNYVVMVPAPAINGMTPASAKVGTGVTITGWGFTGATSVRFNGTDASFTVDSDLQISTSVPQGATTGPISITAPGGTGVSLANFTVVVPPPPAITAMAPVLGPVGTSVTITGSGFAGATAVRFNGTNATFAVNSDTKITATVPQGATTGPISVIGSKGTGSSGTNFIVTTSLTFPAAADTYVASGSPTKNFGTATTMQLAQTPRKDGLIRFTVSGIGTRTVLSARLRLYCVRGSASGGVFYPTTGSTWNEKSVTWKTAPAAGATSAGVIGSVVANTWYEVDLSSLVRGDGTYSLRVLSGSTTGAQYGSREGKTPSLRPQLVLIVG